jgi:DNA-directed RNA polymerase specialized sigma24 family protein
MLRIGTGRQLTKQSPDARPQVLGVDADDQAIVLALLAREVRAMELVYDRWSVVLFTMARSVSTNGPDAERLVMEACLELWRRPELALRNHRSLRNYMCTLVLSGVPGKVDA